MSDKGRKLLDEGAAQLGVALTPTMIDQLGRYLNLVEETNKHTNLTRICGDDAVTGHFLDTLSICQVLDLAKVNSLADIGTGLGVPGMVLKIVFPHLQVLLVDSLRKRIDFLQQCVSALSLKEVTAIHGRAEVLGQDIHYRETFSLCVSRAVARLKLLAELCVPFIKRGGSFIAYKGGLEEDELSAAREHMNLLGLGPPQACPVSIPGLDAARVIVIAAKQAKTPGQFPRSSNALSKLKG